MGNHKIIWVCVIEVIGRQTNDKGVLEEQDEAVNQVLKNAGWQRIYSWINFVGGPVCEVSQVKIKLNVYKKQKLFFKKPACQQKKQTQHLQCTALMKPLSWGHNWLQDYRGKWVAEALGKTFGFPCPLCSLCDSQYSLDIACYTNVLMYFYVYHFIGNFVCLALHFSIYLVT